MQLAGDIGEAGKLESSGVVGGTSERIKLYAAHLVTIAQQAQIGPAGRLAQIESQKATVRMTDSRLGRRESIGIRWS